MMKIKKNIIEDNSRYISATFTKLNLQNESPFCLLKKFQEISLTVFFQNLIDLIEGVGF